MDGAVKAAKLLAFIGPQVAGLVSYSLTYIKVSLSLKAGSWMDNKLLEAASRWLHRAGRGPKVEVPPYKVALAARIIEEEGPIGRYALAARLRLGEGVVKALLAELSVRGLVEPHRGVGCTLTELGKVELYRLLRSWRVKELKRLDPPALSMGRFEVAALVDGASDKVRLGLEQRDEAVKVGAKGALTLVYRGGRLVIPGVSKSLEEESPELARRLESMFKLEEGDVVVICSADDRWVAEEAALASSLTLTGGA